MGQGPFVGQCPSTVQAKSSAGGGKASSEADRGAETVCRTMVIHSAEALLAFSGRGC